MVSIGSELGRENLSEIHISKGLVIIQVKSPTYLIIQDRTVFSCLG